jgi:hypothetical protein
MSVLEHGQHFMGANRWGSVGRHGQGQQLPQCALTIQSFKQSVFSIAATKEFLPKTIDRDPPFTASAGDPEPFDIWP